MIPNLTEENSEAYFYFSLADFEEIIKEYGVQFCFEKMSPDIKEQLLNFFKKNISSNNKKICSLLKKNVS
jgi:ribosome biogenesis SPOUT family RNA methylase Rps3